MTAVEAVLEKSANVTMRKLGNITMRKSANAMTRKPANAMTTRLTTNKSVNAMTKKLANIMTEGAKTTMLQFIQPQETWIINSGASSHICKDAKRFENFKPVTGSIGRANSKAIAITGEGRGKDPYKGFYGRKDIGPFLKNMVDLSKSMENPSKKILEGKEIYLLFTVEKRKASKPELGMRKQH